jgi:alanyl-tRNA synthetase
VVRLESSATANGGTGDVRLVTRAVDGDANQLKTLGSAITAKPGHIAVLVTTAKPALVAVARSADVAIAAQQIVASLTARFGGRGGGRPEFAQAGGLEATPEEILDAARTFISSHP